MLGLGRARETTVPSSLWWQRFRIPSFLLVLGVLLGLIMGMSPVPAAAEPPSPKPDSAPRSGEWVEPTGEGLVRPDVLSAGVTARSSGQRVEVLSERTEFARTWALPDGTFDAEAAAAPTRFVDETATKTDGWRDVDVTLKANQDGSVSPAAVPNEVVLNGGGDDPANFLIKVVDADGVVISTGPGVSDPLPEPVLDGPVATYPEVLPGVDIRVEVRPAGFEQLWVVKDKAGLEQLLGAQSDGIATDLTTKDATAIPQADGSVRFEDATGKKLSELVTPSMWDSKKDSKTGEATARGKVKFELGSKDGRSVSPKKGATGKLALTVRPDAKWLSAPEREFPIMIDPTYAEGDRGPLFDTWVQQGVTTDQAASTTLKLGKDSAGNIARTYINFPRTAIAEKRIMSATLSLYATESGTCSARGWSSYNSGVATNASRWTDQPTLYTKYATSTATKGFSTSCPDATVTIDMTDQVGDWAAAELNPRGMLLRADSETDSTYYKRFNSGNAAAKGPMLRWTYNRAPSTMSAPSISNTVSFTPAGSSTAYLYTGLRRPTVSGVTSDPDKDTVRGQFYVYTTPEATGGAVGYCTNGAYVASGSTATCTMESDLVADGQVYIKARATDGMEPGALSTARAVRVASVTPTAPVISCSGYADGSWAATEPALPVSCTISAAGTGFSAPSKIRWSVDGKAFTDTTIPQSSSAGTAKTTVTVPVTAGGHSVRAIAYSPVGKASSQKTYQFGYGAASLTAPAASPRITTTDRVTIGASGPPKGASSVPTAKTQWRVAGATGSTGWVDAPAGNELTVTDTTAAAKAAGVFDTETVVGAADGSGVTVNGRVPTLLNVRVCLAYTSGAQCTTPSTILKVPHAFGSGFPIADGGPGQVALWTGELSVSETDAELSTPDGGLSVSRTHTSFAGVLSPQNSVFGPGWSASFEGDGTGFGGVELVDGTNRDGSLALVDVDGSALVFTTPTGARRTTASIPTGTYLPADEETATAGVKLVISGSGASTIATVTGDSGVITRFQVTAAPTAAEAATFKTLDVAEPAVPGKTSYSYDTAGRVIAITGALPDGVTSCVAGTASNGCRVLKISYATTTTATASAPGDYTGRVQKITVQVNTDTDRELAAYKYDATGRLVQAKDSRTNLTTAYTWTGTGTSLRLATMTPPGLAAYTFNYDITANKIKSVTRPNPAAAGGGTAQLAAFVYGVPISGTGLPNLTSTTVEKWNQDRTPTWATAVFGQDKPITSINPSAIATEDWAFADLQYTDAEGYTVNTANYGAGAWQYTAVDYDTNGNIIREWDQRAIRGIIDNTILGGTAATDVATLTTYNTDITSGGTVVTPAGTFVTDTYGPIHEVTASNGEAALLRAHTKNLYDQGAPNSGTNPDTGLPYRLLTRSVVTAEDADGVVDSTSSSTLTGYNALVSGDKTGWALGQGTTSTIDMDLSGTVTSGDITTKTRYDDRGRTIEQRQPKSNGADAGTRLTTYYTAGTASVTACGSKPALAGLVCQVGPAAQPPGETLPTTRTSAYTWDGQESTSIETSAAVTATAITTYDAADRVQTEATVVAGLAESEPIPTVTTTYHANTGLPAGTSSSAGSTGSAYDSWGREVTYTNTPVGQPADTATTAYNSAGQIASVVDNNGATNYTYNGKDANGNDERRGLITQIAVKINGGTDYTSTGAYDEARALVTEKLPGKLIRRTLVDIVGTQTGLTYNGQAVDPETGTLSQDQPWLGWTLENDAIARTTREWAPSGDGLTSDTGTANTSPSRIYAYDRANRLTGVQDRNGNLDSGESCQTRTYDFDTNGNRTTQNTILADNGDCPTSGGTPLSHTYDAADRITQGANGSGTYTYDSLGRQTTIPESDAPNPNGSIALRYFDSDAIHTIAQGTLGSGGTTTTFNLDADGRRLKQTTQTDSGTSTLTRHYTDDSDDPAWSVDTADGTTTTTRYAELVSGDLGLTFTTTSGTTTAALALATPRGDIATTVQLPAGATSATGVAATGIDNWTEYTEFGIPKQPATTTPGGVTGIGYGWLGGKQRASDHAGLLLLGARVLNPMTGQFTSLDPIFGGNVTQYGYPLNPITDADLNGEYPSPNPGGGGGGGGGRGGGGRGAKHPPKSKRKKSKPPKAGPSKTYKTSKAAKAAAIQYEKRGNKKRDGKSYEYRGIDRKDPYHVHVDVYKQSNGRQLPTVHFRFKRR